MNTPNPPPTRIDSTVSAGAASRLWNHMAETHRIYLLAYEENDIRYAADADREDVIRIMLNERTACRAAVAKVLAAWDSMHEPEITESISELRALHQADNEE